MCGIGLIIDKSGNSVISELINRFTDRIIHRGPDDEGYYHYKNLAFGHRRLAIQDLSPRGHQPMEYLHRYVINFNGEIFNFVEIREDLKEHGYVFNSGSDTEVILAAYDHWGFDCEKHFNGMWAFVILDKQQNIIFGSRDRYGIKPMYYYDDKGWFTVCSELKQLVELPGFQAVGNLDAIHAFLENGHLNRSEFTFFKNVKELQAGHQIIYDLGKNTYQLLKWYNLSFLRYKKAIDWKSRITSLFRNAVDIRLRADVSVGVLLSGGIDSSAITAVAASSSNSNEPPKSYSVCYKETGLNEIGFIENVLGKYPIENIKVWPKSSDVTTNSNLEKLIYHQDQPIPSFSHLNEFLVYKLAHDNGEKVVLDGQGADEFLAGYSNFIWPYFNYLRLKGKWGNILKEWVQMIVQNPRIILIKSFCYWLFSRRLSKIYFNEFDTESDYVLDESKMPSIFQLSLFQMKVSSLPYQLHSADRSSMMYSIEGRFPFLDHRLVEFYIGLDDELKFKNGTTKYAFREAIWEFLPMEVYKRKSKLGFPAPEEDFFRQNIEYFLQCLEKARNVTELINDKVINEINSFKNNQIKYDPRFFRYSSFAIWVNVFNVKNFE